MAKTLTLKQKIELMVLKQKVKKTLSRYKKEFKNIMDVKDAKSDYKFLVFIVYFIREVTGTSVKPALLLRELEEKGVIDAYVNLTHKINDDKLLNDVSLKTTINEFTIALIKFISDKKSSFDKDKLTNLICNVIKLINLTDNAPQFDISAQKNLNNNYEDKVETAINITKVISNVQNLLINVIPESSNDLIVLINNLIRKLYK